MAGWRITRARVDSRGPPYRRALQSDVLSEFLRCGYAKRPVDSFLPTGPFCGSNESGPFESRTFRIHEEKEEGSGNSPLSLSPVD